MFEAWAIAGKVKDVWANRPTLWPDNQLVWTAWSDCRSRCPQSASTVYSVQFAEITAWLTEYGIDDQESRHEIIELAMALDDQYRAKLVKLIKEGRENGNTPGGD